MYTECHNHAKGVWRCCESKALQIAKKTKILFTQVINIKTVNINIVVRAHCVRVEIMWCDSFFFFRFFSFCLTHFIWYTFYTVKHPSLVPNQIIVYVAAATPCTTVFLSVSFVISPDICLTFRREPI